MADSSQDHLPGFTRIRTWATVVEGCLAGRPAPTVRAYRGALHRWAAWCDAAGIDPLEAHRADAQRWLDERRAAGRAANTILQDRSAGMAAYRWAIDEDLLERNPFANTRVVKAEGRRQKRALSRGELTAILAAARRLSPTHAAFVTVLADTGERIGALCQIDAEDYLVVDGHAVLESRHRKRGKQKTLHLGTRAAEVLDEYLGDRTTGPLLVNSRGARVQPWWAREQIKVIARLAGVARPTQVTPHMLRHTWVTHSFDAGLPIEVIQDGAGHADPATTRLYDQRKRFSAAHAEQLEAFRYVDAGSRPSSEVEKQEAD